MKKVLPTLLIMVVLAFPALGLASSPNTNPLGVNASNHDFQSCFLGIICVNGGWNSPDEPLTFGGSGSKSAQGGSISSIQEALASISFFIGSALLPLLFGIALLVFLVNAARYFIIGGGNETDREKARSLAMWGIGAFVLLVSIWGIVNLFVTSFNLNQEQSLCPDYLDGWCGDQGGGRGGFFSFFSGGNNRSSGGTRSPGADTRIPSGGTRVPGADTRVPGGNTRTPGGEIEPSADDYPSAVAELVFGGSADVPSLNYTTGKPRSLNTTVAIPDNNSCIAGMNALQLASEVENTQAAYVFYTDNTGAKHWLNVTDLSFESGVAYDADIISSLKSTGITDVYLIHTHQKDDAEFVGIQSKGYPPSHSDMELYCDQLVRDFKQVVVDWENVWVMEQNPNVCPRRSGQEDQFKVIESLLWITQVQSGDRAQEFTDLINAVIVPSPIKTIFDDYLPISFDAISSGDIYNLTVSHQNQAQIDISRFSTDSFCATL